MVYTKCIRCHICIGEGFIEIESKEGMCITCYNKVNGIKEDVIDLQKECDQERERYSFYQPIYHMKF